MRKRGGNLKRYTAIVPKTAKATRKVGKAIANRLNYFLNGTAKTIYKTTKLIDKKASRAISSFTRKRLRR